MHAVMTTVGDLVADIYQEVLVTYGNETTAALITALLVDQLLNGSAMSGPVGK